MTDKVKVGQDGTMGTGTRRRRFPVSTKGRSDRVQRSFFLNRTIDRALRLKAIEDGQNLTETINRVLEQGLCDFLS